VEAERAGSAFHVEEIGPSAAGVVIAAMANEGDLVMPRLERSCRCFAGMLGDEVVAYGWVSTGAEWIGELGLEIRPAAGEAYIWNCVTLPAHRRRGYFGTLLRHLTGTARREGVPRLWIGSVDGGAERAVAAAGFLPVLQLRVTNLLGLCRLTVRGADGADPGTVGSALAVLGAGGGTVRTGFRRATRRRH
jgi:GNAT superfamily N-acetyltransferase